MAVAHDAVSESHTGTTGIASVASFTWNHVPTGTPRSALVFTHAYGGNNPITSVSYGGVNMTAVPYTAYDTDTEPGFVQAWFLDGVASGTQAVVVNRTSNTIATYATCMTQTAAKQCEVYLAGVKTRAGSSIEATAASSSSTGNSSGLTSITVDDGSPGTNSVRYIGIHGGGSSLPTASGNNTLNTPTGSIDYGVYTFTTTRQTTPSQGAVALTIGVAVDDIAYVALAVRENPTTVVTGSLTANAIIKKTIDSDGFYSTYIADSFSRADTGSGGGWGLTAETGGSWGVGVGDAFGSSEVLSGKGRMTLSAAGGQVARNIRSGVGADIEITGQVGYFMPSGFAQNITPGISLRDGQIHTEIRIYGGTPSTAVMDITGPGISFVGLNVTVDAALSGTLNFHIKAVGTSVSVAWWRDGDTEPALSVVTTTYTTAGYAGVVGWFDNGDTGPMTLDWDNLLFTSPRVAGTNFTADAVLAAGTGSVTGSATADAQIRVLRSGSLVASAITRRSQMASLPIDAFIRSAKSGSLMASAVLRRGMVGAATADAIARRPQSGSLSLDAFVRVGRSGSLTDDAVVRRAMAGSLTAAAILFRSSTQTLAADAVIRRTIGVSFGASAVVRRSTSGSLTVNAVAKRSQAGAFTGDAVRRRTFKFGKAGQ